MLDWKNILLAIFLLHAWNSHFGRTTNFVTPTPMGLSKFQCNHIQCGWSASIQFSRFCCLLSPKTPSVRCCHFDWWFSLIPFACQRRRCPCGLQKVLILLLFVLLSTTTISSNFTVQSVTMLHDLKWYHSHICYFQLALFLTDSQFSQRCNQWGLKELKTFP